MAQVHELMQKHTLALSELGKGIDRLKKFYGDQHIYLEDAYFLQGNIRRYQGEIEKSRESYSSALNILKKNFPENKERLPKLLNNLSQSCYRLKDYDCVYEASSEAL